MNDIFLQTHPLAEMDMKLLKGELFWLIVK